MYSVLTQAKDRGTLQRQGQRQRQPDAINASRTKGNTRGKPQTEPQSPKLLDLPELPDTSTSTTRERMKKFVRAVKSSINEILVNRLESKQKTPNGVLQVVSFVWYSN